jgi:hypothetical protein
MKQPSAVASQPGTDDPSAFVTVAVVWSANADGVIAIIEKTANNTINDFAFSIFYFFSLPYFNFMCITTLQWINYSE